MRTREAKDQLKTGPHLFPAVLGNAALALCWDPGSGAGAMTRQQQADCSAWITYVNSRA